jgi:hypothetical protein
VPSVNKEPGVTLHALLSPPKPAMACFHNPFAPVDLLAQGLQRRHPVNCCHPGVGYQLGQGVALCPGPR